MDRMFDNLRQEYGDIYKISAPGTGDMVVLFRPEHVKTMYARESRIPNIPGFDFVEHVRSNAMKDRYVITGLINNNEDWYQVRHKVQQDMMRPKSALYYITELEEIAVELTMKIEKLISSTEGVLEPQKVLQEYALEAVGCVFMGARLGTMTGLKDGQRLIEISDQAAALVWKLFFMPQWILPYLPDFKKFISLQGEAFDICKKYIDRAIANIKETDDSLLAKLVRSCGKDSQIPLIMGVDSLQVGIDTTGSTATFLLYHLADNPDKQEKLYQEICDVIGPDGNITEASLAKMKYLKACQTESQRMLPAAFGTSRRIQEDIVLGGYEIPKGTTLVRVGSVSSNDAANFENPDKFVPERWLRNSEERHSADSFANIPFGHGARSCIGRRFAQLELYVMMAKIVQKFRLEYKGDKIGCKTALISVPDKPVIIKFLRR